MATAHASVSFQLNVENPVAVIEDFMTRLNEGFLMPKSMQVQLVGSGSSEKIGRSVDGECVWPKDELPAVLPGEQEVLGTQFTALENPNEWLTVPRDTPRVVERLRAHSERSAQLRESKKAFDDDVFWTFWGLTKIVYSFEGSTPKADYFLREKLPRAGTLEPVLRVIGHVTHKPRPYVCVSLLIRGFVWSHYTSDFDKARQDWIRKTDLRLAQENARLLAETLSGFVRRYPDAEIEWETEQEHTPDLRGFIPSELQARIGPPKTPQRVRTLEISK